jgi:hypothetical protein
MVFVEVGMIEVSISRELRSTYREEDGRNIVFAWCYEQFGNPGILGTKEGRWNSDTYFKFLFRDEADAMLFALKWSGR